MKTGKTLVELAQEIQRQSGAKADYVAPAHALSITTSDGIHLDIADHGEYSVTPTTHRQLGSHLGVPAEYYDRLLAGTSTLRDPYDSGRSLFEATVNSLMQARPADERRLVRTLDGNARAFLSDRYRPLDHDEILERVLPAVGEFDLDWSHSSLEVTEQRLYMKLVNPRVQADIRVGDTVQAGVVVTNSEIGMGSFSVTPLVFRLVCSNGMIRQDFAKRKYHTGSRLGSDGETYDYYRDDTLRARNEATVLEMRDLIRGALSDAVFGRIVDTLRRAAEIHIVGDPVKTVEQLQTRFNLTNDERGSVLRALVEGGDLSMWGLANAVTRLAGDAPTYDRSTELEVIGGQILSLPSASINELAAAAA
jgi:hypothetical protein